MHGSNVFIYPIENSVQYKKRAAWILCCVNFLILSIVRYESKRSISREHATASLR